jgi:hypothetical protein
MLRPRKAENIDEFILILSEFRVEKPYNTSVLITELFHMISRHVTDNPLSQERQLEDFIKQLNKYCAD